MFSIDKWHEIFITIGKNKLRSALTAFSVAWGIFMLIILLGAGQGLQNGIMANFESDATNGMWIYSGITSKEHDGLQSNRYIQFNNRDYDETKRINSENIEHSNATVWVWSDNLITYGKESVNYDIAGVYSGAQEIEKTDIIKGRFINKLDCNENKKSVVISEKARLELFKDKNAIGEWINIGGIPFKVVGIYISDSDRDNDVVFVPFSTAQRSFSLANRVNILSLTIKGLTTEETEDFEKALRKQFASRHNFDPTDESAIYIQNNLVNLKQINAMFSGISAFIWLIGIGTIIAGIVGVSNIMLIVVKERTKEIGIRKAIGATPWSIIGDILMEAILITTVAGYFGLVLGVAVLELFSTIVPPTDFFRSPQANLQIAISATILLIICGTIAGFVPARRAAAIKPIVALRDE